MTTRSATVLRRATPRPSGDRAGSTAPTPESLRRYRVAMFGVCLAAFAFVLWRVHRGYFIYDELTYWTERHELLHAHAYAQFFNREHSGHWIPLIMGLWGPLDFLFGAKSYLPYVIPTIVVHCLAGYALFELLVYTRIRAVVALVTASAYLFLGSSAGAASFGWNICIVTPIACLYFGLLMVQLYADRGLPRFSALSMLSVVLAIVSSGFGITVVLVVASSAFARRKWRLGGWLLLAPGAMYLLWRRAYKPKMSPVRIADLGDYLSYTRSGVEKAVESVMQVHVWLFAWVVLAALTVGIAAFVRQRSPYWSVFALSFLGLVPFYASVSTQRFAASYLVSTQRFAASYFFEVPNALRYLYFAGALMLPAFAALTDRLWGAWRWMPAALAVAALWILTSNAQAFVKSYGPYGVVGQQVRADVASTVALGSWLDRLPDTKAVGGSAHIDLRTFRVLVAEHKLPCDADYPRAVHEAHQLRLSTPPRSVVHCGG